MSWNSPWSTPSFAEVVNFSRSASMFDLDQGVQARLMDGNDALLQGLNLAGVDVHAKYVVSRIGKAGAGDEADVTGSKYGDSHISTGHARMGARSGILANQSFRFDDSRYRTVGIS